ncbi:MAG: hypothetical protein WBG88_03420, partial [Mesorhizobium sp.]
MEAIGRASYASALNRGNLASIPPVRRCLSTMLLKWRRQWSQANRDAVVKNEGWSVRTKIVACLIAVALAFGLAVVAGPGAVTRYKAHAAQG